MLCFFVFAATCLTAQHVNAGYSQYFYSGFPTPIQQVQQVQPNYYQSAPVAYQSYVPQFPTPTTHYTNIHHSFGPQVFPPAHSFGYPGYSGYQPTFPVPQYTYTPTVHHHVTTPSPSTDTNESTTSPETTTITVQPPTEQNTNQEIDETRNEAERDDTVITNAEFRSGPITPSATPSTATSNIGNSFNSFDNFRGFGYRNEFEGGRSHFVFITGPEAHQFRQSQTQRQQPVTASRTSASDVVDSVATKSNEANEDHSLDALLKYLENPQVGVQRFYSINNAIVTRRVEDEIPASVQGSLPYVQPISPLFPFLRSNFQLNVETTTTAAKQIDEDKEEHEGAASQISTKSVAPETSTSSTSTTAASTTVKHESTTPAVLGSTTITSSTSAASTTSATTQRSTMEPIVVE